jgi:hypothetical protein
MSNSAPPVGVASAQHPPVTVISKSVDRNILQGPLVTPQVSPMSTNDIPSGKAAGAMTATILTAFATRHGSQSDDST